MLALPHLVNLIWYAVAILYVISKISFKTIETGITPSGQIYGEVFAPNAPPLYLVQIYLLLGMCSYIFYGIMVIIYVFYVRKRNLQN